MQQSPGSAGGIDLQGQWGACHRVDNMQPTQTLASQPLAQVTFWGSFGYPTPWPAPYELTPAVTLPFGDIALPLGITF